MKGTRKEWESLPDRTKHIRKVKKCLQFVKKNKKWPAETAAQSGTVQAQRFGPVEGRRFGHGPVTGNSTHGPVRSSHRQQHTRSGPGTGDSTHSNGSSRQAARNGKLKVVLEG
jgi:hypothetical protein